MANSRHYAKLAVNTIRPNSYNPNRMSKSQLREYKNEIKRRGKIPKPCVVRELEDGIYEIVDGEHSWQLAKDLGMDTIDCEIEDIDDFGAMTLTYKRNRGGTDNPVKLANMFLAMMKARQLSINKLSKETGIAAATLRSNLDYLKVVKSRNHYAGEDRSEEISRLSRSQVRTFNSLPDLIANKWLDAGGYKSDLPVSTFDLPADMITDGVHAVGLSDLIDTNRFRPSIFKLYEYVAWYRDHWQRLEDAKGYVRPVAECGLGVWVMGELPCREVDGHAQTLISTEQWQHILTHASSRDLDAFGLRAAIQSGVRLALTKNGHDLADVQGPEIAEKLQIVAGAPAYIGDSSLSLDEQVWLAGKVAAGGDDVEVAAKSTISALEGDRVGRKCLKKAPGKRRIGDIFANELRRLTTTDDEVDSAADVDEVACVIAELLGNASVGDRPAIDVLRDRLDDLEWPEFDLLAALVQGKELSVAASQWLAAIQDEALEE